jgi:lipopolysaccharide export system protein LptC
VVSQPPLVDTGDPLASRRANEMAQWQARSKRIQFYRRALPLAIVAVVVALAGWVVIRALIGAVADKGGEAIHMLNPRYYGRDEKGRAFVVAAREAVRDGRDIKQVTLAAPTMAMDAQDGRQVKLQAKTGLYQEFEHILTLSGGVKLLDARGYQLDTPTARVDPKAGVVTGDSGVTGVGPLGRITASSYSVYDRGARTVFKGNVRVHIEPRH